MCSAAAESYGYRGGGGREIVGVTNTPVDVHVSFKNVLPVSVAKLACITSFCGLLS